MILALTPHPSLDLLFTADRLVWDDANRVAMPRRRPGDVDELRTHVRVQELPNGSG